MRSDADDAAVASVVGENATMAAKTVIFYLSQGYIGLAQCLDEPFQWTYGVGNSMAAMGYLEQYGGVSVRDSQYVYRVTSGHGCFPFRYWLTVFPWIASDVTFWGCFLVMFLIGYLFAKCWLESIFTGRWSSCARLLSTSNFCAVYSGKQPAAPEERLVLRSGCVGGVVGIRPSEKPAEAGMSDSGCITPQRAERCYPRVLVVSGEPFSQRSATGLTMCSLFKGWPRDLRWRPSAPPVSTSSGRAATSRSSSTTAWRPSPTPS